MKKLLLILFFLAFCESSGQGFDWQYSARLPVEYPDIYAGILFDYSYFQHSGSFDFLQEWLPCCTYENGEGSSPSAGVYAEYWYKPFLALNFGIIYDIVNANFSKATQTPDTAGVWDEIYRSKANLSYITLRAGGKYRVLESHFNLGAHLNAAILINNSQEHYKESLTPERPYADGGFIRRFEDGRIPEPAPFYIYPSISAGYDISLGKGLYATPFISASLPIYDFGSRGSWLPFSYSAGFTVVYGLNID